MTSVIKCVVALFREILYINDTAKIATISITEDESSYIGSKADLPTNFTKIGQYIMISGGSWVFNKKAKGSNDVYARFRLKSQVDTEEIVNQLSFEFSRLEEKTSRRSSIKQWRPRRHSCYSLCAIVGTKQASSLIPNRC
jgi:hypothetical protein